MGVLDMGDPAQSPVPGCRHSNQRQGDGATKSPAPTSDNGHLALQVEQLQRGRPLTLSH
jgi:hypothetical protein